MFATSFVIQVLVHHAISMCLLNVTAASNLNGSLVMSLNGQSSLASSHVSSR